MKAHTSKMDSYSSSIYMNVLPTSLAQTSYHLAPISHLKCLSVQCSSHIHYSYYYGASVLERCVFHRSRIRGARFIVPIPFYCISKAQECFLTVYILPKNPFRVPSEMQLQLLAKKKLKPNLLWTLVQRPSNLCALNGCYGKIVDSVFLKIESERLIEYRSRIL